MSKSPLPKTSGSDWGVVAAGLGVSADAVGTGGGGASVSVETEGIGLAGAGAEGADSFWPQPMDTKAAQALISSVFFTELVGLLDIYHDGFSCVNIFQKMFWWNGVKRTEHHLQSKRSGRLAAPLQF